MGLVFDRAKAYSFAHFEKYGVPIKDGVRIALSYLKEKSIVLGKEIRFFGATDGEGIATDLDENGGLVVQTRENKKMILTGGEISVRFS